MSFVAWLDESWGYVLLLSSIVTVLTIIVGAITKVVKLAKSPFEKLEEKSKQGDQELHQRVDNLEQFRGRHEHCKEHVDECLYQDNIKIAYLLEGFSIIMKAIMVLISHALTGNHVEQLRRERDAINDFLLETPTTFSRRKGSE